PGGVSQPPFGRVSGVLAFGSPGCTTTASKLVNLTSPLSNADSAGTASGAVTRRSDRIIDCPARVIVRVDGCDCASSVRTPAIAQHAATETHLSGDVICIRPDVKDHTLGSQRPRRSQKI